MVVVLDALDEARRADIRSLVEITKLLWTALVPNWLRLRIASRTEDPFQVVLEEYDPVVLRLRSNENLEDVRTFVKWYTKDLAEL